MDAPQTNTELAPIPASIFKRMLAYLLDGLILLVPMALIAMLTMPALLFMSLMGLPTWLSSVARLLISLPYLLYFSILESAQRQASVGKKTFGLYVATVDNARMSPGCSFLRAVLYTLTGVAFVCSDKMSFSIFCSTMQVLSTVFSLGCFMALFTKERTTLVDILTKTRVYVRQINNVTAEKISTSANTSANTQPESSAV